VRGDVVAEHPGVLPRAARLRLNGGAQSAMRQHCPEYLIEGTGLGLFMVSACLFATLLEHPSSPVRQAVPTAMLRRIPMGLAMGLTVVAIIYSRWGQRSGAHLNPAVTLTFWRMGEVKAWDAVFYVTAQFAGASIGVAVAAVGLGARLAHPAVRYAATVPGAAGAGVAFVAELLITFILMTVILAVSNRPNLNRLRALGRGAGGKLYRPRGAALGHEHEPGRDRRLGDICPHVDGALGLLRGGAPGHARGGPAVRGDPRHPSGAVRQSPPREPAALHLSVQLRRERPVTGAARMG
jgi:glycerol uptake facilitator-like aquaporin